MFKQEIFWVLGPIGIFLAGYLVLWWQTSLCQGRRAADTGAFSGSKHLSAGA